MRRNVEPLFSAGRKELPPPVSIIILPERKCIANYFGVPTMELTMEALPEVSLQLEADGIWEQAAARTYLDLNGSCIGGYKTQHWGGWR